MGALSIFLLILGILMLIESLIGLIFHKWSFRTFKKFTKSMEKHLKAWSVGELIVAIILILIGMNI